MRITTTMTTTTLGLLGSLLLSCGVAMVWCGLGVSSAQSQEAAPKNWAEICGPAQAKPLPAQDAVHWRKELWPALDEAKKSGRPLFVTFRCLPCKQCSDFDKTVLDGGPMLGPLLKQFITVRLTTMMDSDLRVFPIQGFQDLDLSWWGWFLTPDGRVMAVYGGKDHVSDTTRISGPGLGSVMQRVLDHYYDGRREGWDVDGAPAQTKGRPKSPRDLKGWKRFAKRNAEELSHDACLHCHTVAEIVREPDLRRKDFDKQTDFDEWPFPENVGLTLDRDDGLKVTKVAAGSAAATIGIKSGDRLAAAHDRKLFGQADFRGVLHRASRGDASVEVRWWSGKELKSGTLELKEGWRATRNGWRKSVAEADIGASTGIGWPIAANGKLRQKFGVKNDEMAISPWTGKKAQGAAYSAGMKKGEVILAVNGSSKPRLAGREFNAWWRIKFEPGDPVELTLGQPNGKRRKIRFRAPRTYNGK